MNPGLRHRICRTLALAALLLPRPGEAAPPRPTIAVAAAANLTYPIEALNRAYQQRHPEVAIKLTLGASGGLFAQIQHGAPFDIFLSADTTYPQQLAAAGLGDAGSLRNFAAGRLVLWTTRSDLELSDLAATLRHPAVRKLAIAQPKTAPYGRAAEAVLLQLGLRETTAGKLVIGESIAQTAHFVETGNADAGFVALSVVLSPKLGVRGRWLHVPAELHREAPLDHAAILTLRGIGNSAARDYLDFLCSEPARKILQAHGYAVKEDE